MGVGLDGLTHSYSNTEKLVVDATKLTRDVSSLDHDPVNLYGKACAHKHTEQYMYIGQTR